jgi:hypothetical protein
VSRFLCSIASLGAIIGSLGCSFIPHTISVGNLGPPNKLLVYDGGHLKSERAIDPNSPEAKEFSDWLQAHRSGWMSETFVTFAPTRLVKGDDFIFDFKGDWCVIGYRFGLFDFQCRRSIDPHDPLPALLTSPD